MEPDNNTYEGTEAPPPSVANIKAAPAARFSVLRSFVASTCKVKTAMPGYKAVYPEAVEKGFICEDCELLLRSAVQLKRDGTLLCESCYEQRYATMASYKLKL